MATTTITFNGGSTTSATSNTSNTTSNTSPIPTTISPTRRHHHHHHHHLGSGVGGAALESDNENDNDNESVAGADVPPITFHYNNNNSVTRPTPVPESGESDQLLVPREKCDTSGQQQQNPSLHEEEEEEEEGEIRAHGHHERDRDRELASESSGDSCSQEELHYHHHLGDHGSSASSASRNKKRKQSRPIRIPCTTDSSASMSPHAHSASGGLTPLNLSGKPNHHNGPSGGSGAANSSMHSAFMSFNLPSYPHASASISPSSPSSSSNSNSESESRARHRLSTEALDLGGRDRDAGSRRLFGPNSGQGPSTGNNHHHHHPHHRIFNPEAYCDLCNKEFCNKYFLKTHKANKHGVYSDVLPAQCQLPANTGPSGSGSSAAINQGQSHQQQPQSQSQLLDTSSGSNRDSFCHLCNKDFCNKYFLRRHRAKIHGIQSSSSSIGDGRTSGWTQDESESMEEGETTNMTTESRRRSHQSRSHSHGHGHSHSLLQNRETECKSSSSSSNTSNSGQPTGQLRSHELQQQHSHHKSSHRGQGDQLNTSSKHEGLQMNNPSVSNANTASNALSVSSNVGSGPVFECSLCSHTFPSIYLLHMHMSYFHSTAVSASMPFTHGNDSIVTSASSPMAYLGLKLGPSPSPPNSAAGIHTGLNLKQHDQSHSQDDDLRRLQSMILELSHGGGGAAAAVAASASSGASSIICPICCKEFYSPFFLSQHISSVHGAFSSINLPLPPPLTKESSGSSQAAHKHHHQLHMQLKTEANEDDEGDNLRKRTDFESDEDGDKQSRLEEMHSESNRVGVGPDAQNEMMVMMMMMNAGAAAAAASAAGGLGGIEDDESNNNTRESRNGHKKLRPGAQRNIPPTTLSGGTSLLLQDPAGASGGQTASSRVTPPNPMLPKTQKPVSPSLSRSYCTICHKELCNKYFMRTHMLKMHGINIESSTGLGGVTCDICHKELCSKYFLKVHKQNTHGIVDEIGVAPMLAVAPGPVNAGLGTPENGNDVDDETASVSGSGRRSHTQSPSATNQQSAKRNRGPGGKWTSSRGKGINGGAGSLGSTVNNEEQAEADEDGEQPHSRPHSIDNHIQQQLQMHMQTQIKHELPGGDNCLSTSPRDGNMDDGHFQSSNMLTPMLDPLSMLLQKMDGGSGKLLYCRHCPFTTSLLVYLYAHERTHTPGINTTAGTGSMGDSSVQLQCPMCFMTFGQVDQFQQHLVSHQLAPVSSPQSTTASLNLTTASSLNQHSERKLSRHRINNNNESEYKICETETTTAQQLQRPFKRMRVVRFKCSMCGHRFGSHTECQSHIIHEHQQRQRLKMFQSPGHQRMEVHANNDNNGKPPRFQCRRCGFGAREKKALLIHTATSHRAGRRLRSSQRFAHAFAAGRNYGAASVKLRHRFGPPENADMIVQRFLLRPDRGDGDEELGAADARTDTSMEVGKKSGYFVPSVIYLPVREIVSEPLRVSLTPTSITN